MMPEARLIGLLKYLMHRVLTLETEINALRICVQRSGTVTAEAVTAQKKWFDDQPEWVEFRRLIDNFEDECEKADLEILLRNFDGGSVQ